MLDQSRTPHVSAVTMRRPQSSAVGGGVVSCIGCGAVIPLASASLAGVGYRCQTCGRASQPRLAGGTGAFDLRAQQVAQRSARVSSGRRAQQKAGSELIVIGAIVILLGAALMPLAFWWLGAAAMIVGGVAAVVGVARRKAPY